jgi:hypothetical protein
MARRKLNDTPAALLEHEFAQERASALGRLGRALEAALAALAEFDAAHPRDGEPGAAERDLRSEKVAQASAALWQFMVQREACGLRDSRTVIRDYRVPPEVAARMGALPEPPARRRR